MYSLLLIFLLIPLLVVGGVQTLAAAVLLVLQQVAIVDLSQGNGEIGANAGCPGTVKESEFSNEMKLLLAMKRTLVMNIKNILEEATVDLVPQVDLIHLEAAAALENQRVKLGEVDHLAVEANDELLGVGTGWEEEKRTEEMIVRKEKASVIAAWTDRETTAREEQQKQQQRR